MGGGVGGEVTGTVQGTATCGGKRGIFRLGIEGNPIKPPDPQSGFQTAACPLFSLIPPTYGRTAPLSCGPASQNVLATESAHPLSRPIPSFSGVAPPLRYGSSFLLHPLSNQAPPGPPPTNARPPADRPSQHKDGSAPCPIPVLSV